MLKPLAAIDLKSEAVASAIAEMATRAHGLLQHSDQVTLTTRIPNKAYFGFRASAESRPINRALFLIDPPQLESSLAAFRTGFVGASAEQIIRGVYTIAYSVLAANDCWEVGRKASATFFEVLIGHLFARWVGVNPRTRVRIPESGADLPTDYVFDTGDLLRKAHLPIKTSTRERAVQAWVHQLVLDRIFGNGSYLGILVVASETKRNIRTGEVIEICVPRQLQMFQSRVAEMARLYYLDPPQVYLSLATGGRPQIAVKSFGEASAELLPLMSR